MLQTNDYRCIECKHLSTILVDTRERDEPQACEACGAEAHRTIGAHIARTTYLDGTNRWAAVKESRNLDKTISSIRKARRLGKMDADTEQAEISRVKAEKNQLLSKGKTLKAEIPIKGEG